jgi:hypothetical protein
MTASAGYREGQDRWQEVERKFATVVRSHINPLCQNVDVTSGAEYARAPPYATSRKLLILAALHRRADGRGEPRGSARQQLYGGGDLIDGAKDAPLLEGANLALRGSRSNSRGPWTHPRDVDICST